MPLYLNASARMLPIFAASGHNNYTKCVSLHLRDCHNLCSCLNKPMNDGYFTIKRNKKLFWSGTWSDMTIEQMSRRVN